VFFLHACLSTTFFSQYAWLVYLPKDFDLKNVRSKLKNWTPFVQDVETHGGLYVIKLYDLKGSFFAIIVGHKEEQWQELFASFAMVGSQIKEGN